MSQQSTIAAAGGHARADALTPERRSEIARGAAGARWNRSPAIVPPDDGVRELLGVAVENSSVRATEGERLITVRAWNGTSGVEVRLCSKQARRFADQLYSLAARVERRNS